MKRNSVGYPNMPNMTQADICLIEIARKLSCTEWDQIPDLINRASSRECKLKLKDILSSLYHKEEYESNLL